MTPKRDEIGEAMRDAINARVQRQARRERAAGTTKGKAWTPPRCAQCRHRPADIERKDYSPDRPYFCSKECFRAYRDHLHGFRGRLATSPEPRISTETAEEASLDAG